jgi:hypothetical protein
MRRRVIVFAGVTLTLLLAFAPRPLCSPQASSLRATITDASGTETRADGVHIHYKNGGGPVGSLPVLRGDTEITVPLTKLGKLVFLREGAHRHPNSVWKSFVVELTFLDGTEFTGLVSEMWDWRGRTTFGDFRLGFEKTRTVTFSGDAGK